MLPITKVVREILEGKRKLPVEDYLGKRVVRTIKKEPCSEPSLRSVTISYSCLRANSGDVNRILKRYEREGFSIVPTLLVETLPRLTVYAKHLSFYSSRRMLQISLRGKDEYVYEFTHIEVIPFHIHDHSLHLSPIQLLRPEGKKVMNILEDCITEIYSI